MSPPPRRWPRRVLRGLGGFVVVLGVTLVVTHVAIDHGTRFEPPKVSVGPGEPMPFTRAGATGATLGESFVLREEGLRIARLVGTPEDLGAAHAKLLHDELVRTEAELWRGYGTIVRAPLRPVVLDLARYRYRGLDLLVPEPRRREIAAEAAAFSPDPFANRLPAYTRLVLFHALYDIALAFEEAPFLGCTSFVLRGTATADGHTLVGRVFDFEASDVFDQEKVVFLVRGEGTIPYASIAWGGLTGVLSGMNAEGVVVYVQGARAGEAGRTGVPIVFSLRGVLERAHDVAEATAILAKEEVLAPHLVVVADAKGEVAIVERAPGSRDHVVRSPREPRVALSNHYEGPLAGDPKNERVRSTTTTKERRARMDALLAAVPDGAGTPERAVAILRDHGCDGDAACPLGDRRAIDALIATHGFLADTTSKELYVSKGPHLAGAFVRLDLGKLLAPDYDPRKTVAIDEVLAEDPVLRDGRYEDGRRRAGGPLFGPLPK